MRVNNAILVALLAVAGFGAGMMLGRRLALRPASTAAGAQTAPAAGTRTNAQPAIKARSQPGEPGRSHALREPMSLAEIEAAMQQTIRRGGGRANRILNDLVRSANPADIPQLLAFVEKLPIAKVVVASSQATYGEAKYRCKSPTCLTAARDEADLIRYPDLLGAKENVCTDGLP